MPDTDDRLKKPTITRVVMWHTSDHQRIWQGTAACSDDGSFFQCGDSTLLHGSQPEHRPAEVEPEEKKCKTCGIAGFVKRIAKGVPGLLKAEFGIDEADKKVVEQRRRICESCSSWDHGVCTECECFTAAKSLISSEKCPLEKWPKPL